MTSDETPEQQLISKSARKREATALQELGVQLAGLPDAGRRRARRRSSPLE